MLARNRTHTKVPTNPGVRVVSVFLPLNLSLSLVTGHAFSFFVSFTSSQSTLSTVRHESSFGWIFKSKGVSKSQDADLEMSQGSNVSETRSL